jgi:hypothetical protein
MKKPHSKIRTAVVAALISASLYPVTTHGSASAAADGARLPRTDFPACSATQTTYCISEVTITDGGVSRSAKWVPSGTAVNDASGAPSTKTFTTFGTTTTTYTGRWSYDGFPVASRDFDGVYVRVAPANEFTDTMSVNIEPAGPNSSGAVGRIKDPTTSRVGSLPLDMRVKVTVRLGELNPAVTIAAGNDVKMTRVLDGTVQVMTFEGNPTPVAQASSSADCDTSTSVAVAKPNQLYAIVAFKNGRDPFGVDGLSGDMVITSNGTCKLSTPTWNSSTMSMDFTSAAPHFAPDGQTMNTGYYRAIVPAADADLLFGLKSLDAAASSAGVSATGVSAQGFISATKALTVEVRDTGGSQVTASRNVSFDGKQFVVSATGFTFSTKTIRMMLGTPPNAPQALSKITTSRSKNKISLKFTKSSDDTTYQAYLASAKAKNAKKVALTCKTSGKIVTCTSKPLASGGWNVTVTPVKDGMAAATSKATVKVP